MVWITKPTLGTQLDWANPLNSGLAAFWVFNENGGDKVYDLSGNTNTGTLTNIAFPSTSTSGWNPGRLGPAIVFDGADDYIGVGNTASLSITQAATVEAWIYRNTNTSTRDIIVSKGWYAAGTNGYVFLVRSNYLVGNIGDAVSTQSINGPVISEQVWHHVAFTFDGSYLKLYLDGSSAATPVVQTLTPVTNVRDFIIGFDITGSVYRFNGIIDSVRVYNRALTDAEIQELYINPYGMFLEGCSPLECNISII